MPLRPSEATSHKQKAKLQVKYDEWKKGWDEWSDITCPCGWGYFNTDGIWVSGADVRKLAQPVNPIWKGTGGRHPQAPSTEDEDAEGRTPAKNEFEAFPGKLCERDKDTPGSWYVIDVSCSLEVACSQLAKMTTRTRRNQLD
jgi:hypothetical protein